ncbi:MAG: phytoene/squalene synthase family protein [Planctomycetota bacterium]
MTQAARINQDIATAEEATSETSSIEASYEICADIVRNRARNFYHGLLLTPEPKRSAIYSIYAWMRRADDAVDAVGSIEQKRDRLNHISETTAEVLNGHLPAAAVRADPIWPAFAETVRRYELDHEDINAMLAGLEDDLRHESAPDFDASNPRPLYETRDELVQYCFRVASIVGKICVTIWGHVPGVDRSEMMRLAELRGLAFQLTNILRDFREDYHEGRIYIAREDLAKHDLSPQQVLAFDPADRCTALIADIAAWARQSYEESAALDAMIDPQNEPAMWAMTRIYSGLLERIEQDPSRVVSEKRIRLASARKAAIGVSALLRAKVRQR